MTTENELSKDAACLAYWIAGLDTHEIARRLCLPEHEVARRIPRLLEARRAQRLPIERLVRARRQMGRIVTRSLVS